MKTDDPDSPIPLRLAIHLVPRSSRTGKAVHVSVLYRWKNRGLLSPEGVRTHLRTMRVWRITFPSKYSVFTYR